MHDISRSNINDSLYKFICNNFPAARQKTLAEGDNLLENGIIDSMGLLTIISHIEDTFNLRVREEDVVMENFGSIAALNSYVNRSLEELEKGE